MLFILSCAILASTITVITRKLREIHFSLMMFSYGFIATLSLGVYLILEYLIFKSQFLDGMRLFSYDKDQWILLMWVSLVNAIAMNCVTIAQ